MMRNERQKRTEDSLQCWIALDEAFKLFTHLKEHITDASISEVFGDLQCSEMNPVCLFPTRKQCDDVNADMLSRLDTEMHEIPCFDEVDESKS